MASTNRMSISFGNTEEDHEVYNYLKNDVSNASALIRVLVKMYKDGNINFGGISSSKPAPSSGKQDVKSIIHNRIKEENIKEEIVVESTEEEEITPINEEVEVSEVEVFNRFKAFGNGALSKTDDD